MSDLKYESIKTKNNQVHFTMNVNGVDFVYLYIKKNACSSWKKFFVGESESKDHRDDYSSDMSFMGKYHKVTKIDRIEKCNDKILVLRDPVERLISGYVNQYLMRLKRPSHLHKNIQSTTGIPFSELSFKQFIESYLLKVSLNDVDKHFLPQICHLAPINYNHIWIIDHLYDSSREFFGETIANKYFLKRINSTKQIARYDDNVSEASSSELYVKYLHLDMLPSKNALLTDELREKIEIYYKDDVLLYNNAVCRKKSS